MRFRHVAALLVLATAACEASSDESDESEDALGGPPSIAAPAPVTIDEDTEVSVEVVARGIRTFEVEGLPPGARFDRAKGRITFRPDFTQSGTYSIAVTGHAGGSPSTFSKTVNVTIVVRDSIRPPAPVIKSRVDGAGFTRLTVEQTTDAYLDSPGRAGRTFSSIVVVPTAATPQSQAPVIVSLHGFGGSPNAAAADAKHFRIEPHDPDSTYWWGYAESLPRAPAGSGPVPPYTLRRVMNLVSWLLSTYPAADRDRVFSTGASMGGAGALTLGLVFGRHFAGIEATIAQTIPRNHRPSRIAQLQTLWGSPNANRRLWDDLDLTRRLSDDPEARNQFIFTKHGKDDPVIHFGAVVMPSPLTQKTFYGTLEAENIGHYSVWDEGAHGPIDPVLGDGWWDQGWSRIDDPRSFLKRTAPFPAFARSSVNRNPGDMRGNGKKPFDRETGFSADVNRAGDTGWNGDIAGTLNRFLRWDTTRIVDTRTRLTMPLFAVTTNGSPPPVAGYPAKGDLLVLPLPIKVDVTPRRARAFNPAPGERVRWRFGAKSGVVTAAADGSVTVPSVEIGTQPTDLVLETP